MDADALQKLIDTSLELQALSLANEFIKNSTNKLTLTIQEEGNNSILRLSVDKTDVALLYTSLTAASVATLSQLGIQVDAGAVTAIGTVSSGIKK